MINDNIIIEDLGLNTRFEKGRDIPVRNCWHFSSDGNAMDLLFGSQEDFRMAMNRIYMARQSTECHILAFCLMNNHVHFILYGELNECKVFMHSYIRRISMYLRNKYGKDKSLKDLPINYQVIDTQQYLKTAICYVLKNPTNAGMPYMFYDYPWSSAALYFRVKDGWSSVGFGEYLIKKHLSRSDCRKLLSCDCISNPLEMMGDLIFPQEYVDVDVVESLFRSHRSYMYYICRSSESDIESRDGYISRFTLPDNELIQYRRELSKNYYGQENIRLLNAEQRFKLCRMLLSKYNCSKKQVVRICGLKFSEVKNIL